MVTSAVSQPQKTENLAYAVIPVSFALWIAGVFPSLGDNQLATAAIIAGFLTLLIFETGPDEWWVKRKYRRLNDDIRRDGRRQLLAWNAKFETWIMIISV